VICGRIELHIPGLRDGQTLCHIGGAGYWFGDLAALSGTRRRFDVLARSDCQLMRLPRAELQRTLAADPAAWRYVALLANGNLDLAVRVVEALKQQDPASRIGLCLQNLVPVGAEPPTRVEATRADLAAIAGVSW
jgi:CRP-like cAMP-binding protein